MNLSCYHSINNTEHFLIITNEITFYLLSTIRLSGTRLSGSLPSEQEMKETNLQSLTSRKQCLLIRNYTIRRKLKFYPKSFIFLEIKLLNSSLQVNESRYVALFVFSGSIKKLFSIDCINIYLFSIFFSIDFAW